MIPVCRSGGCLCFYTLAGSIGLGRGRSVGVYRAMCRFGDVCRQRDRSVGVCHGMWKVWLMSIGVEKCLLDGVYLQGHV